MWDMVARVYYFAIFLPLLMPIGAFGDPQPFTVARDIGVAYFGNLTGKAEGVRASPDGNYFAVDVERGRLDVNRPESSLRFYRTQDIRDFLNGPVDVSPPVPIW